MSITSMIDIVFNFYVLDFKLNELLSLCILIRMQLFMFFLKLDSD